MTKSDIAKVRLRSNPIENLSKGEIKKMLIENNFFSGGSLLSYVFFAPKNKQGKGLNHQYEVLEREAEKLVIDYITGLTWQQSGSLNNMKHDEAKKYIKHLNTNRFADYNNWRLPTLEEAMSLMEPEKKNNNLYINEVFDNKQIRIWTADKESSSVAWVVTFLCGYCGFNLVDHDLYVRAVR